MSIATIMIINVAAAGILSAILAAVMLAPARHLRPSHEQGGHTDWAVHPSTTRHPVPQQLTA